MFQTKKSKFKSLLNRQSIRIALLPKEESKNTIQFSPVGYYDENTDIYEINKYVLDYFDKQIQTIPTLQEQVISLTNYLNKTKLKIIEQKDIQKQIDEKNKLIITLQEDQQRQLYLDKAVHILEEYDEIIKQYGNTINLGEIKPFDPDKLYVVRAFIHIASKYCPLNLTMKPFDKPGTCLYCRTPYVIEDDGKFSCYICDIYKSFFIYEATYSDINRTNGTNNNNYTNKEIFIKTLNNYQGKETVSYPKELYDDVDKYCETNAINKSTLTSSFTRYIFKKLGYSTYYNNINLFLYTYIDKTLPDLSKYETDLSNDYDMFTQTFNEIKGNDRNSSLNSQYVLYILIKRRNIECEKHDFQLPETTSILRSSDEMSRKVFEMLGWIFEDTN